MDPVKNLPHCDAVSNHAGTLAGGILSFIRCGELVTDY